jgi:hypothetical protein
LRTSVLLIGSVAATGADLAPPTLVSGPALDRYGAAGDQGGLDDGNGVFYRNSGNGGALIAAEGTYTPNKITLQSVTDGTSNTFMIGESLSSKSLWTGAWAYSNNTNGTCAIYPNAPQTTGLVFATNDWGDNYSFHSNHSGGLQFALRDGTVCWSPNNISIQVYRALATRDGGETAAVP